MATDRLVEAVDGHELAVEWTRMVRDEIGLVMMLCRVEAEERKSRGTDAAMAMAAVEDMSDMLDEMREGADCAV